MCAAQHAKDMNYTAHSWDLDTSPTALAHCCTLESQGLPLSQYLFGLNESRGTLHIHARVRVKGTRGSQDCYKQCAGRLGISYVVCACPKPAGRR